MTDATREMRIAVMGAGGVGGYFGGRLAASGADVSFIARGAHLAALRGQGLAIISPLGDATIDDISATDDPADIGPVDVVLFAVKLYDTDQAARAIAPLIGADTAVVSFQNGVEAADRIAKHIDRRHIMGGVAQIPAVIERPGVIRHGATLAKLIFGEFDGRRSARAEALLAALQAAAIDSVLSDRIEREIWTKFVILASVSALTCLTRLPFGPIRDTAATRDLLSQAIHEVETVARAKGVALADDVVDRALAFVDAAPAGFKTSMLHDLERGNRLELDHLSGAVVRHGAASGVDTPVHRMVVASLAPHAEGAPALAD